MLLVFLAGALGLGAQNVDDKIDPNVARAFRGGRPTAVILLGKRQLLEGPMGFPEFCAKHKDAQRTKLRPKIIAQLKAIAKADQMKLRASSGSALPSQSA